jgi:streptomycin 6-kinase
LTAGQELAAAIARWGLTAEGASVRTQTALVQFASRAGQPLVLKLVLHPDEADQRAALAHFGGRGAVRLLDWQGDALLLERAVPGEPLAGLVRQGRDDEATEAICEVMSALHRAPGPPPAVARSVESWGRGFDRIRPAALERGVDAALIDRAQRIWGVLAASQGPPLLLHGDLHHYNILSDARGWVAIDPKGVIGERAFETGAALRNPNGELALIARPDVVARRAAIMAGRLGLEPGRLLGWAFSQAVLSALWSIEDGGEPGQGVAMACATLPLLQIQ